MTDLGLGQNGLQGARVDLAGLARQADQADPLAEKPGAPVSSVQMCAA